MFTGGVVDASDPERAKVAFFIATVAICITKGFDNALFGKSEAACAIVLHAFGGSKGFLMFSVCRNAAFYSHG